MGDVPQQKRTGRRRYQGCEAQACGDVERKTSVAVTSEITAQVNAMTPIARSIAEVSRSCKMSADWELRGRVWWRSSRGEETNARALLQGVRPMSSGGGGLGQLLADFVRGHCCQMASLPGRQLPGE